MVLAKKKVLDEVDIKLLEELVKDGRQSFTELAKKLNMSHSSVRDRVNNLVKMDLIRISALLNISALGFKVAFVNLEVKNHNEVLRIISNCSVCPHVLFAGTGSGEYNVFIVMVARDIDELQEIIEKAFRSNPYVNRLSVTFGNIAVPKYVPLKIGCDNHCFCDEKICKGRRKNLLEMDI